MKKTEESLLDNIKKAFSAFSYEHSGEMLSSHNKSQMLSGRPRDKLVRHKSVKDNISSMLNKSINSKRLNAVYDRLLNKPKL